MAVKNMAASELTRLKNQTKIEGISFQMVLQLFAQEEIFDFDGEILKQAVSSTLNHRKRELMEDAFTDVNDFRESDFLLAQWKTFEPAKVTKITFDDTLTRLILFLEPIYKSILQGLEYNKRWSCENKQWMCGGMKNASENHR